MNFKINFLSFFRGLFLRSASIEFRAKIFASMLLAKKKIEDKELQVVLEKRYLCFESWEKIAVEMNYSIQHIFRLHSKALKNIEI